MIYDSVSPGPSQFFEVQLQNGKFEASVKRHAQTSNIDKIVVDFAGRNLTPLQMKTVNEIIKRLPNELRLKVIKFE